MAEKPSLFRLWRNWSRQGDLGTNFRALLEISRPKLGRKWSKISPFRRSNSAKGRTILLFPPMAEFFGQNLTEICQGSAIGRICEQNARFASKFRQSRTYSVQIGPKIDKIRPNWPENGPLWGPNSQLSDHRSELSGSKILKLYNSRLWRHFSKKLQKTCPCNLYTVNYCVRRDFF